MKRNLFAVAALVIAVSMSAFTINHKAASDKPEPLRYWYTINMNDLTGFVAFDERADVVAAQSVCKLSAGTECIRGYNSPVPPSQYSPAPTGVDNIKRNP